MENSITQQKSGIAAVLFLFAGAFFSLNAQSFIATGKYTGDKVDNRVISGIGFTPDAIIIKGDVGREAIIWVTGMAAGDSKQMGGSNIVSNRVQNITSGGFEIGEDDDVNKNAIVYYWTAFKSVGSGFTIGTYKGDGTALRKITGLGYAPDFTIVVSNEGDAIVFGSSSMTAGTSCMLNSNCSSTSKIKSMDADGFSIGSDDDVNRNNRWYSYIAGKNTSDAISIGSFTGDASSGRGISAVNFQPAFTLTKANANDDAVFRNDFVAGDKTLLLDASAPTTNMIQSFTTSGFTVGSSAKANRSGSSINFIAFKANGVLASRWNNFNARRSPGGLVTTEWQINNPDQAVSYTVERSSDMGIFTEVETIPALSAGESNMSYTLIDEKAPTCAIWYRIRENRADQSQGYSALKMVDAVISGAEANLQLTCFPNPTHDHKFFVRLNRAPKEGTKVKIYDLSGRLVMEEAWEGNMNTMEAEIILPSEISNGSYFVEVIENNIRIVEKIVVE